MRKLVWLAAMAGAAMAQQGTLSGPTSGLVFDRAAGTLRPVLGVPGAATMGDGLALGFAAQWVVVAPRLDSAVAAGADGTVHFLRLPAGAERPVAGVTSVPREVVFSPSGTAAALVWSGEAQVVTGWPDAPVLSGAPMRLARGVGSLAVSDDGAVVLVWGRGVVKLAGADGRTVAAGVMAAFAPGGHDAVVADGAGVSLVRDVAGAAQATVLAADGVESPVGLAFSAEGATVFAAGSKGVVALSVGGGAASAVACGCQPATVAAMGGVFRLNDAGQGPLWLLDPGGAAPRTVFVPAAQ